MVCLEPELGEEPTIDAGLESSFKFFLDDLQDLLFLGRIGGQLLDLSTGIVGHLFEWEVNVITGGHQMVVVVHLEERLDFGVAFSAFFGHATNDLAGISIDSGDQSVSERFVRASFVKVLDDDSLATGKTTVQDKDDLVGFHDFDHLAGVCWACVWALMAKQMKT